jgi:hypothetical protein
MPDIDLTPIGSRMAVKAQYNPTNVVKKRG